jgi:hypothetical protein
MYRMEKALCSQTVGIITKLQGCPCATQGVHELLRPFHFQGLSLWQFALGQYEALYYVVINTGALFAKVHLFKDRP